MKRFASILLVFATCSVVFAQYYNAAASDKSRNYHRYRQVETSPSFDLKKVEAIVAKIQSDGPGNEVLSDKAYNAMPVLEKFTYVMIHREQMNQNCDAMPDIVGEETKIFGVFPDTADMMALSDRQIAFLKNNKSEVTRLLRTEIKDHSHVGLNTKMAIVQIDDYALIPDLVTAFNRNKKDLDVLTTLMILMKDGKDPVFEKSATYRKLYGPNANAQSFVEGNTANQKLTIQRAMAFYNGMK